jgi:hypothetical protein
MRLNKKQREAVLTWVAEGLQTDEINRRAAKFKPKFKVSRAQVDFYRHSRNVPLEQIKQADEKSALMTGLAIVENRVAVLQRLASKLIEELLPTEEGGKSLLWLEMAKTVAKEQYDYQDFNHGEVEALRGVLDDIASEVGGRIRKSDITSNGESLQLSPEQIAQRVTLLLELARKRKDHAARK